MRRSNAGRNRSSLLRSSSTPFLDRTGGKPTPCDDWNVQGLVDPKTRSPKTSPAERDLARAQDRIARLEAELARTRLALEITGKAHALLEMLSQSADTEPKSKP